MLIDYTSEELQHIREIQETYKPEWNNLSILVETAPDKEERKALILQRQTLYNRMITELDAYADKCQHKRFEPIQAAGSAAIIQNAKTQAPGILEYIHKEILKENEGLNPKALVEMGIGITKKGRFYINTNYAMQALKNELKLHIDALTDDKPALQELLEALVETVEESDFTDGAEITETEKPIQIMRFRRSPLADIVTYGLMNDKVNAQLIQDGGIFETKPDGQLQLLWNVNQAPQDREQVPVYISLTYEGLDAELCKKLNAYDNAVYNAVSDLFYYWQKENPHKPLYITPQEIWRRMNGKQNRDGSAKPSAAQIKRICKSIHKMRHIDFYMDISEEINARYITLEDERLDGGYIKDYLLNCSEVGFYTERGRKVTGYRINYEPILYTYNTAKNHILFLPFDLLDTSSALSDGENVTEFKQYLLQQILLMKNGIRSNNKILLSTIYKTTGIKPPEERLDKREFKNETSRHTVIRRLRKADKDKIEGLLEIWKAKKWIKGYTALNSNNDPVGKRQTVAAYDIRI